MSFLELTEQIKENGLSWDLPTCCDPNESSYSLLRFQAHGEIFYSQQGVWLEAAGHDEKCRALLQQAKRGNYDLVLFPEYCVSYGLLGQVARDDSMWPGDKKLWVLPCQGITCDGFDGCLKEFETLPNVFLLETAVKERNVNKKQFVTAMFYCFRTYRGDVPVLCLVPQLKTHPMADSECHCEQPGMSTGNVIFTLNKRLITLLCADSLNNEITWQSFQKNGLTNEFVILHPQLNSKPKDHDFSRLRREMYNHGQPCAIVTCNWAAGTTLSSKDAADDAGNSTVRIKQSWSCIYRKHGDDCYERWRGKDSLRRDNEKHGLYGAFMKSERTEVWFSPYHEHALRVMMPNLASNDYGKTLLQDIYAMTQLIYCSATGVWGQVLVQKTTLQERINSFAPQDSELSEYSKKVEEHYRFPLDTPVRSEADGFFSITLADFHKGTLEIDRDENLSVWTLLIDETDVNEAMATLMDFWHLIHILINKEALPANCVQLREPHKFCYRQAHGRIPSTNIRTGHCEMTVSFAANVVAARRHAEYLKDRECSKDEDLYREFVRVFFRDPISNKPDCIPRFSSDITRGSGIIDEGDIADGEG